MLTYVTTDLERTARALYQRYGSVLIPSHRRADFLYQVDYSKLEDLPVYRLLREGTRIVEQWERKGGILVQYKRSAAPLCAPAAVLAACPLSRRGFVYETRGCSECAVVCLPVNWDLLRKAVDHFTVDEEMGLALYKYLKHRSKYGPSNLIRFVGARSGIITPDFIALPLEEVQRYTQLTQDALRHMARKIGMATGQGGTHFVRFDLMRLFYPPKKERDLLVWNWVKQQPEYDGWHVVFRETRRPRGYTRLVLGDLVRQGCLERQMTYGLFAIPARPPVTKALRYDRQREKQKLEEWREQVWSFPEFPLEAPAEQSAPCEAS